MCPVKTKEAHSTVRGRAVTLRWGEQKGKHGLVSGKAQEGMFQEGMFQKVVVTW